MRRFAFLLLCPLICFFAFQLVPAGTPGGLPPEGSVHPGEWEDMRAQVLAWPIGSNDLDQFFCEIVDHIQDYNEVWMVVNNSAEQTEVEQELARARQIARPVKLLALLEKIEGWQVDTEVITAVMEAAEAGIQIDSIYEGSRTEAVDATVEEEEERAAEVEAAQPVGIYRLGDGTVIHFGFSSLRIRTSTSVPSTSTVRSVTSCFNILTNLT